MPMPTFSSIWTQLRPPEPDFTEKNLPDLAGKVYIITGGNTGIGKELARMLYSKNGTIYVGARSEEKAERAIDDIRRAEPNSTGALVFLHVDLADLRTIKSSVESFTSRENRLDVLFNNAGIQAPGGGAEPAQTTQGYEIHLGVNTIGTFLLTRLLTPTLVATVRSAQTDAVRVVWVSSSAAEFFGEKSVGLPVDDLDYHNSRPALHRYGLSKAGNWLHGAEFARRHCADGIVSIPLNPGNVNSDLYRDQNFIMRRIVASFTHSPVYGAYTELFAGLSPQVTMEKTGSWVGPFGRFMPIRSDLMDATKAQAEGGNGHVRKVWDWTEDQVSKYM
ncbi:putative estradiol 17 beta-dehydrogenase [Colletotrichum acutatum]|uniref:Estradiol 17 beta-dehydrogenase n=1 Tax=Glomerella acutata TaxID=27357 RepID=A0AAD8XAS0_GLOAC|nr:putative estradiol 17 beta-dehydrogenase [Colletotrichum acutatum]KAK1702557.1 putative estradiol 17 beta-dehydrogenase [Colletotrichum acutatum]